MMTKIYHLEFITPCFCAGADQAAAEFRAPSIRGKLRWWFRVLGGSREQEAAVFGSVAGGGASSSVVIRTSEPSSKPKWQPIQFSPSSDLGYLLYFAEASCNHRRWNPSGALPAGTACEMKVSMRRRIAPEAKELFDLALEAFLLLGSLGLRGSRGLGCFQAEELPFSLDALENLKSRIRERMPAFRCELAEFAGPQGQLLTELGRQLRGLRKEHPAMNGKRTNLTPLGSSNPRQASAVYLRPVKESANHFRIVVFEAPAEKVLGKDSRNGAPVLRNGIPAPISGAGGRRSRY